LSSLYILTHRENLLQYLMMMKIILIFSIFAILHQYVHSCSTFIVGKDATIDGSVITSHSDDGEGNPDSRLVYIPSAKYKKGSKRPILPDLEDNSRFIGYGRGKAYEPDVIGLTDANITKPIGFIDQVETTYGYYDSNYGVINDVQLTIGESTCSARYGALAVGNGGEALMSINELSRIAMERCNSSRIAVQMMGDLAVKYGFYGAGLFEGGGETLLVGDTVEGWVFHVLADPTGTSAIWVARRVPDDEASVVMNMYTIRDIDLSDTDNYLASPNILTIAENEGLWKPSDGPLDFAKIYSDDEYAHLFYSGRRMWRGLSLFAPSLKLDPVYTDIIDDKPYPWSVKPDNKVSVQDIMNFHRDYYQGTDYDMTQGLAAGPFGVPDRYTHGEGETQVKGNWERSIGLHRSTYSFVNQARAWLPNEVGGVTWFGQHSAWGTCYVPFASGMTDLPWGWQTGNATTYDRNTFFFAVKNAYNIAHLRYDQGITAIQAAQKTWETKGADVQKLVDAYFKKTPDVSYITSQYMDHSQAVLNAWNILANDLMVNFSDGFAMQEAVGYPAWWLKDVGYENGPPPPPVCQSCPPRKPNTF